MELSEHPGYFGFTSQGVIAIHADWPMYPEEHGHELALLWLTAMPPDTKLRAIDDIDRCTLLVADVKCSRPDDFDAKNFHVALWHSDLLELQQRGLISGVSPVSERDFERHKRARLPDEPLFIKNQDGSFTQITLPDLDGYDAEDLEWVRVDDTGLSVTLAGRERIGT